MYIYCYEYVLQICISSNIHFDSQESQSVRKVANWPYLKSQLDGVDGVDG